ncbi:hypothetical protein M3Y99_01589200 [Aphelenchoides fujianensis]|nr:hypothetical protein M3Y99_01589200 [Aphelenchoides fujianensis]
MPADSYVCSLCHVKVKTKLKRAHELSAKHREKTRQQTAPKRPAAAAVDESEIKRPRPNESIELHSVAVKRAEADEEEVASGLPADFFDSAVKKKEASTAEHMEQEFTKFMGEVQEIEKLDTATTDRDDVLRNELDDIDEQIDMWRSLNELEKQKEQLISEVRARAAVAKPAEPKAMDVDEEAADDDDEEIDLSMLDWRSRKL